jgi:DNA-binding transcriptional regulator YdaS (Cro superfamily)
MLKEFITTSGKSAAHWAGVFGVSPSYLSNLISGKKTPSLEVAARIERATGGAVSCASWIDAEQARRTAA